MASVRDQAGGGRGHLAIGNREEAVGYESPADGLNPPASSCPFSVHHHVQDACSPDGSPEWLARCAQEIASTKNKALSTSRYSFSFASEADEGMYEAINRGVERSLGERSAEDGGQNSFSNTQQPITSNSRDSVIAWLNCDEQYLPHTLEKVAAFFASNPDVDLLFGGMLMVDESGELLACRKALPMRRLFLEASYLYNYSCATFFRESFWRELGGFDTDFKNVGDEDLIRRAMRLGARSRVLGDYLATFAYDGNNLSSAATALEEHQRLKRSASPVTRIFKLPLNLLRLGEKFIRRGHIQKVPVEYEIYADSQEHRTRFVARNPSCRWPGEERPYLQSHRLASGSHEGGSQSK